MKPNYERKIAKTFRHFFEVIKAREETPLSLDMVVSKCIFIVRAE